MRLEQGAGEGRRESVVNELKVAAPAQGQLRFARRNGREARGVQRNSSQEACPGLFSEELASFSPCRSAALLGI